MNCEEYKNIVLLKENLTKLKHSPLAADSSFRKLFGAMKDHCENVRLGGLRQTKRRPISTSPGENATMDKSMTSIFVLLSHMLVEQSRSREKNRTKLQQIQLWFANQLPELYENLTDRRLVFPTSVPEDVNNSPDMVKEQEKEAKISPRRALYSVAESGNSTEQLEMAKATLSQKPGTSPSSATNQSLEFAFAKRRPYSASASLAYLDSVVKRVYPDDEALSSLQFASRRGMPFAHRYTAHSGGERPENSLMKGIKKLVVENAAAEANGEVGGESPRCQSALDSDLVDRVASELEHRRERIAATPTRGFRQPVVPVEPNTNIVSVSSLLAASTAPPSTPRGQSAAGTLNVRRVGSLLITPQSTRQRSREDEELLATAQSPRQLGGEVLNTRSTPVPPPITEPGSKAQNFRIPDGVIAERLRARIGSAPPALSARFQSQHSSQTAARMQKQRREFNQVSRESAGFQVHLADANPEEDLRDVLRVRFLLRSRSRPHNYRFSMRDHYRLMRQMSASSQRAAASTPATGPAYFSFCASATAKKTDDESEDGDTFDLYGRSASALGYRRTNTPNYGSSSYGADIVSLVGQVDSAIELSRTLQLELERFTKDEKRPEKLEKNLEYVGQSVPIYLANIKNNAEIKFEAEDRRRRAAVKIQRLYRGYYVRRLVANIRSLMGQIDTALRGLVTVPKGVEGQSTRWQTEAKLYRRLIERIVMYRLEAVNKLSGEKYPRKVQRPSIAFMLNNFTNYLETKLVVATEFRRRAIGGTIGQAELPSILKALGISATQEQIETVLHERFGMRYRYRTKPLPAVDFIDFYWTVRPPAGTPPPPKVPVVAKKPEKQDLDNTPRPPNSTPKPDLPELDDEEIMTREDDDKEIAELSDKFDDTLEERPSSTFLTQQEFAENLPALPPPAYSEKADSSNDLSINGVNFVKSSSSSSSSSSKKTRPVSAMPESQIPPYVVTEPMSRPSSSMQVNRSVLFGAQRRLTSASKSRSLPKYVRK